MPRPPLRPLLRMIAPDEALALVLEHTDVLGPETVPADEAVGRFLAADIQAGEDRPRFDRVVMDGYAVRLADRGGWARNVAVVPAGESVDMGAAELRDGECVEVMTGAPVPPGAEAVVMVERVEVDGDRVRLPAELEAGQHIVRRGAERRAGETVLRRGARVTPMVLAGALAAGRSKIAVHRRPTVAVLSTGSELRAAGEKLGAAQIIDTNGPMLAALVREAGGELVARAHAADDGDALDAALAAVAGAEVVVLCGGVSMGRWDLVPALLERAGARAVFHKATQKPGKPILFAVEESGARLFFGLPGNPLSAHFCFQRYVAAALRKLAGGAQDALALRGTLAQGFSPRGDRTQFVLARVGQGADGVVVTLLQGVGSADIFASGSANAIVRFEPGSPALPAGAPVDFVRLGGAAWAS